MACNCPLLGPTSSRAGGDADLRGRFRSGLPRAAAGIQIGRVRTLAAEVTYGVQLPASWTDFVTSRGGRRLAGAFPFWITSSSCWHSDRKGPDVGGGSDVWRATARFLDRLRHEPGGTPTCGGVSVLDYLEQLLAFRSEGSGRWRRK